MPLSGFDGLPIRETDYPDARRRLLFHQAASAALLTTACKPAFAMDASSTQLDTGLLESRVTENLINPPPYGMEGPDIFYPSWFAGTWNVASTTSDVQAPCGVALFGGNRTWAAAQSEIGQTLSYASRFLVSSHQTTIADREFNVRSIAQAAMGPNSVLDVPFVSPNKLCFILAPTVVRAPQNQGNHLETLSIASRVSPSLHQKKKGMC